MMMKTAAIISPEALVRGITTHKPQSKRRYKNTSPTVGDVQTPINI
jgi:hypothetical protein